MRLSRLCLAVAACAPLASVALADFSGQTILGPLTLSSNVNGNLVGAPDLNDGWFSGTHFFEIWTGGDQVWQLNWAGGDLDIKMTYDNLSGDPDLFLYTPGSYDESSYDSYANTGLDEVLVPGAPAGLYYILIDSTPGAETAYNLQVLPTPGAVSLFGLAGCVLARRRRAS